jgi:hypothetical protein
MILPRAAEDHIQSDQTYQDMGSLCARSKAM